MIELQNVSKIYSQEGHASVGIRKINLKLDVGEFVAITGESGSGKTTLLNVISGIDTYEEGEMYVNGEVCDDGWPEGRTAEYFTDQDCYESTFSEETLNPDMPMFLDADLNLILTSTVFTTGGSSAVNVVYNLEGSFLGSYGSSHEIPYDYQLTFYQETMYLTIRDRSTDTCTDLIYEDGEFVEA